MPDSLSIITGVVALLQITARVGTELKRLHDGASIIQETISGLTHDVDGFTQVLESMRVTFTAVAAIQKTETGHIANLWENVAKSVKDGKVVLGQLLSLIQDIDDKNGFLEAYKKQLRLDRAAEQMHAFRVRIQSYRDGLQLCLSAIILWNQTANQTKADQVLPNLSDLHNDVRRLARCLNDRIDNLQSMVRTPQNESEVVAMGNLRDCVRSAASTVSSATTIISARQSENDDHDVVASDFGDCFPSHQNLTMSRWMAAGTISEYEEVAALGPVPESIADLAFNDDVHDGTDSEDELEDEMTCSLLESGKQKLAAGDNKGAEKNLRFCLDRINAKGASPKSRLLQTRLDAIQQLYGIYYGRREWDAAQQILLQKLDVQKRSKGQQDLGFLNDVLSLARLMIKQNNITAAHLHARQALRGFRRLNRTEDVKVCLRLLITFCQQEGNDNDTQAYSVMLDQLEPSAKTSDMVSPLRNDRFAFLQVGDARGAQPMRYNQNLQPSDRPMDQNHQGLAIQEQSQESLRVDQAMGTISTSTTSSQASEDNLVTHGRQLRRPISDDGRERRKSGFSAFMNNLVSSPVRPAISAPANPVHVTHITYDEETEEFVGLPEEWKKTLELNRIRSEQQQKSPHAIMDVVTFFNENAQHDSDAWAFHKFDNSRPPEVRPPANQQFPRELPKVTSYRTATARPEVPNDMQ